MSAPFIRRQAIYILAAAAAFAVLSQCAKASEAWSQADKAREAVFLTADLVDYGQTQYIAARPHCWREINPILGEHPSHEKVVEWFVASAAVHALITDQLPARYRPAWQYVTIGFEVGNVARNAKVGIKFTF